MTARSAGRGAAISALFVATAMALAGCGMFGSSQEPGNGPPNDDGQVPQAVAANALNVQVGDCFVDTGQGKVKLLPCSEPHEYEAYAAMELPAGAYPGDRSADAAAQDFCRPEFETFTGMDYDDSVLQLQYFYPKEEDWTAEENRAVLCLVADQYEEPVTGTLQDAGR